MSQLSPSRFEILPVVIKNILIITGLAYLAQISFGPTVNEQINNLFGFHYVASDLFMPWQAITHLFLHGSFSHLLGNMFAFWMFGAALENVLGAKRFLLFYLICGVGAAVIHSGFLWYQYYPILQDFNHLKHAATPEQFKYFYEHYGGNADGIGYQAVANYLSYPDNMAYKMEALSKMNQLTQYTISGATIGASGAVFGVLAAFIYLFPNTYIYVYFLFPIKAKWIGLAYFGIELYHALINEAGDNVARWAHLGGGLVGFLIILFWKKKKILSYMY